MIDMDGDARPFGAGYDLGANEYTGQATRTPTPTATSTQLVGTVTPTATRASAQRVYVPLLLRRQ